jgi:large subunit ribosomal protein L4
MATVKKTIKKIEKTPKKTQVKAVKTVAAKKTTVHTQKKVTPSVRESVKPTGLTTTVVDVLGKNAGTIKLPEELFNAPMNQQLLTQSVRIYLANQREGSAQAKTRGEVSGSTRKIYKQKGTGRARHGGIRAPIFVGGGIAFGPRAHEFTMSMPKKMKRKALACALTQKYQSGDVIIIDGMESMLPKTKEMAKTLQILGIHNALLIIPPQSENISRSARNIASVETVDAQSLYAYIVLKYKTIVIPKSAVAVLEKTFVSSI